MSDQADEAAIVAEAAEAVGNATGELPSWGRFAITHRLVEVLPGGAMRITASGGLLMLTLMKLLPEYVTIGQRRLADGVAMRVVMVESAQEKARGEIDITPPSCRPPEKIVLARG